MRSCPACPGFVPPSGKACPNCGTRLGRNRRLVQHIVSGVLAASTSMTLMACYGGGPGWNDDGPCFDDVNCGLETGGELDCDVETTTTVLEGDLPITIAGTRTGASAHEASCGGSEGAEVLYTWTPTETGYYRIFVESSDDTVVYLRSGEMDVCGAEIACDAMGGTGTAAEITAMFTAGQPLVIVVDGASAGPSDFTLTVEP